MTRSTLRRAVLAGGSALAIAAVGTDAAHAAGSGQHSARVPTTPATTSATQDSSGPQDTSATPGGSDPYTAANITSTAPETETAASAPGLDGAESESASSDGSTRHADPAGNVDHQFNGDE